MDDETYVHGNMWMYRAGTGRGWHTVVNNVHIWWYAVVDDFGNLVWHPTCYEHATR